jgi:hypothetical protein
MNAKGLRSEALHSILLNGRAAVNQVESPHIR